MVTDYGTKALPTLLDSGSFLKGAGASKCLCDTMMLWFFILFCKWGQKRTSWFRWKQRIGKYWNHPFWKLLILSLVQQYWCIKLWLMGWLVGLWDGAHRWNIRNNFWSFIISFLIYQKLISEFSEIYFCNTINCNFAGWFTKFASLKL